MSQEITYFFEKLKNAYNNNLPFVIYRKPNENIVYAAIQNSDALYVLKNFKECGFVFAPFHKNEAKILFPNNECEQFSIAINNFDDIEIISEASIIEETSNIEVAKKQHVELVEKAIECIQKKEAEKIVVSRKEILNISNFKMLASYKKMLKNYKNAMVYLWFHPKVGHWMGASPERLLNCEKNQFKTMALAGTQAFKGELNVVWQKKEQIEQQFVTDYILKIINESVSNVECSKPYTVKAGNLLHLRTDILGNLTDNNTLESLINGLHPTPAVCGLPKEVATNFICQNEGYDRSFYSGYFGELNVQNQSNLFVNLRCMQIHENNVSIYIGGGITATSEPEKEWEETVFKAQVMKSVL